MYETMVVNPDGTEEPIELTNYQCEAENCESEDRLVETYSIDEDGQVYYTIKCRKHWRHDATMRKIEI